jgi:amidase
MNPFNVYSQKGPMARSIADLALFADALAGPSSKAGLSKPHVIDEFRNAAAQPARPLKIAYSENLGVTETTPEVVELCARAVTMLEQDGIGVDITHPDLSMADTAFRVPRALDYAQSLGADLANTREILKPEIVWNVELGLALSGAEIRQSQDAQRQVFANASAFMQDYDLLLCPATILPAYPIEERYPGYSAGLEYAEYYRWLAICCAITTTTLPVITLPCGKTDSGLPIGLQLIGKPHGEPQLFALASYIEQIFDWDPLQAITE